MTDPSSQESLALKPRAQAPLEELVAACAPSPARLRVEGFNEITAPRRASTPRPGESPTRRSASSRPKTTPADGSTTTCSTAPTPMQSRAASIARP